MPSGEFTLLLTDDDQDDRFLFKLALLSLKSPAKIYTADNGKDALSFLKNNEDKKPDVIFMDINMPVMNGWEFLQAAKADSSLADIPIIMYSTSNNESDITRAKKLGVAGFCIKPNDIDDLKKILEHVVAGLPIPLPANDRHSRNFTRYIRF